jgi:flagellar biogenesis protein FliO
MDTPHILQAVISFVFVLGLMFVTLWFIKYCRQKGWECRLPPNLKGRKRLKLIERQNIDIKSSVVLFSCDQDEFLVLLGDGNSQVLRHSTKDTAHD